MGPSNPKRILVIEDDHDIRSCLVEILEWEGYLVQTASNGQEGLDVLGKLEKTDLPDLILLDLMMPIKDGYQFREEQVAIEKLKLIPVVVMSADGNIGDKKNRARAKEYVRKPVDLDEILAVVARNL